MSYALAYHYTCGLRHIVGQELEIIFSSSITILISSTWKNIQSSSLWIIFGVFALSLFLTVAKLPALKNKEETK